ncbi:MAG: caspase family protein [Lentisphaeria bacterium]|nr:caspase family protein [Lentisphaeria bacterium]
MRRVGLFVGIDKYKNGISQLQCAVSDAHALAVAFARAQFDSVELLLNEEADYNTILDTVKHLVNDLGPGDLFVFYFSGHGREINGVHYLVASPGRVRGSVSISVLTAVSDKPGLNRLFILDCCRSNIFAFESGVFVCEDSRDIALNKAVQQSENTSIIPPLILNSCSIGEQAFENVPENHGYFTKALLDSINNISVNSFSSFRNSLKITGTPRQQNVCWIGDITRWNKIPLFKHWEYALMSESLENYSEGLECCEAARCVKNASEVPKCCRAARYVKNALEAPVELEDFFELEDPGLSSTSDNFLGEECVVQSDLGESVTYNNIRTEESVRIALEELRNLRLHINQNAALEEPRNLLHINQNAALEELRNLRYKLEYSNRIAEESVTYKPECSIRRTEESCDSSKAGSIFNNQKESSFIKKIISLVSALPWCNKPEIVYSSIFAPAEITQEKHLLVQVYFHLYEETETVISLADESDKKSKRRGYLPLSLKLKKGDKIDIEFNVYGKTHLMSRRKSIVWHPPFTKCSFDYFVPGDIDVNELSCEANIFVNGAMIGEMRFITKIVGMPRKLNPMILSRRFNKIFISYAHKDAQQVRFLALAYKAQGIDYFYDRDSLALGDVYEEKIFDYIDSSDLFILCWSKNAAESSYVAREKKRAMLRAYPQCSIEDATLKICPISIEPRAELPNDMKHIYNFEEI